MVLKFKVTRKAIKHNRHFIGLQRAPYGDADGWNEPDLTLTVKPEDTGKYRMGQVLTFMSIAEESLDQGGPDYEAEPEALAFREKMNKMKAANIGVLDDEDRQLLSVPVESGRSGTDALNALVTALEAGMPTEEKKE